MSHTFSYADVYIESLEFGPPECFHLVIETREETYGSEHDKNPYLLGHLPMVIGTDWGELIASPYVNLSESEPEAVAAYVLNETVYYVFIVDGWWLENLERKSGSNDPEFSGYRFDLQFISEDGLDAVRDIEIPE